MFNIIGSYAHNPLRTLILPLALGTHTFTVDRLEAFLLSISKLLGFSTVDSTSSYLLSRLIQTLMVCRTVSILHMSSKM
jgi:hypothetical protein